MQVQVGLGPLFEKRCPRGWKGREAGLGQEACHVPMGKPAGLECLCCSRWLCSFLGLRDYNLTTQFVQWDTLPRVLGGAQTQRWVAFEVTLSVLAPGASHPGTVKTGGFVVCLFLQLLIPEIKMGFQNQPTSQSTLLKLAHLV